MQDALHDWLAAEQQEVDNRSRQANRDNGGNYNLGGFGFRTQLGVLTQLHLPDIPFSVKVEPRMQGKNKNQQTHANHKAAFHPVAMLPQKAHVPTRVQKR